MLLEINMKFIFNILFFSFLFLSCDNNPDTWINNTIKSEKDVLMATSIDLKKLISKSNLGNIDFLTSDQKLIYSSKFDASRVSTKNNKAIIIDYKTSKGDNDINQLTNYLTNINLCEFDNVSAFLLYVSNNELLEVTLK